jgi:hypothetical protein
MMRARIAPPTAERLAAEFGPKRGSSMADVTETSRRLQCSGRE